MRTCEKCTNSTVSPSDRFCRECGRKVLRQLEAAGYLMSPPEESLRKQKDLAEIHQEIEERWRRLGYDTTGWE